MPSFDLVVVGSGGGPSEVNISGYLLKAHDSPWKDGIIGLEAGSGFGALKRILEHKPDLFVPSGNTNIDSDDRLNAARIYSYVRTFLITHAHLDHVMGLVLLAGGVGGPRKSIRGSRQCLEDLETIFRPSRIWPNLASWNEKDSDHMYFFNPLDPECGYTRIHDNISARMMSISHGSNPVPYQSTAFFIRHDVNKKEFLFFGDVEPDSLATNPQTHLIWHVAAPKFPDSLNTIFIECSWPSERSDDMLYGHLSPEHLVQELTNFAVEVALCKASRARKTASASEVSSSPIRKKQRLVKPGSLDLRGVLSGLNVYVIHCKEDMESKYDRPMHKVITEQVSRLMERKGLGATVLAAEQGTRIEI